MRVSARTEYGLVVMMDLAALPGGRPLTSRALAERSRIRKPFLDQVMADLRKAGLIRSVRGPGGGYVVARDPRDITIEQVIEALEGGAESISCVPGGGEGATRRGTGRPALVRLWSRVDTAVAEILRSMRLDELVEAERRLRTEPMYYI